LRIKLGPHYYCGTAEGVIDEGSVAVVELSKVVWFFTDSGISHISDSVELTKLSIGLLGLHISAFCSGEILSLTDIKIVKTYHCCYYHS